VGAFQPRTLKVEGIERFQGTQLFHDVGDPATFADKDLVIVGGDDAAVEWALNFCAAHADRHPHKARRVTLLHRRDVFRSSDESLTQLRQSFEQRAIDLVVGQITGFTEAEGKLVALKVTDPDNVTRDLALDMLLVLLGVSPKLGPVADWGLDLERKQLQVDTEKFSTNVPGIFAVGDINTYPGKKKLIVCGFHECVLAAFGAAPLIFPDKKILLQYTTTSPRLHALLGVAKTASD